MHRMHMPREPLHLVLQIFHPRRSGLGFSVNALNVIFREEHENTTYIVQSIRVSLSKT